MVLSDLYRRYAGGSDHPMKGRLLGYLERLIPGSGIEADTVQGIRMRLDPWRSWERHLLRGGTYRPSLNRFIETNLRSGDIVAIAGISFGQQIIIASQCVGSNGIIIGIDPASSRVERMSRSATTCCCHGRVVTSNTWRRRDRSSRELAGRTALVGKSFVVIARTALAFTGCPLAFNPSTIALAKPCQLVLPELARWTSPSAVAKGELGS